MNYIDLHCDTILALVDHKELKLKDAPLQINIDKLEEGNSLLQCFAMFIHLKTTSEPFKKCIEMIDRYYQELALNEDKIAPVFQYSDIEKNCSSGKISSLLTIEEGGVTEGNLSYLRILHRLGVRMICLNWNFVNGVGHPNFTLSEHPDFHSFNVTEGLTPYGLSMIEEMNRLGIIIDVSHLSDKGFYDCIQHSKKPIVASHSNARGVCYHSRNLSDEMILLLAKNGGVMGMNFCAAFLDEDEEEGKKTIACVIRHMQYIKDLAGVDVIAIGTDFDGIDPNIELKDASMMPQLFAAMRQNGFTEEEIEKIAYKNFLRVLKRNLC